MWVGYVITSKDRLLNGELIKMLNSLPNSGMRLVVGCRGFETTLLPSFITDAIELPLEISLSDARNILLDFSPSKTDEFVFFPDDDCWFPSGAIKVAEHWLKKFDFVIGVIDMEGGEYAKIGDGFAIQGKLALEHTASAAIFARSKALKEFRFSRALGLGTKFKAGEDLDLVFCMLREGQLGVWTPDLRIGHPKKNRSMEYFPGSIAALILNSRKSPLFVFFAIRRLIHGFIYFLTKRLGAPSLSLGLKAFLLKRR